MEMDDREYKNHFEEWPLTKAPSSNDGVKEPYPFDEVVDSGAMVRFNMDGNKWCANRLPFTNMMEMPVGFGDTPMQALVELIREEARQHTEAV